MIIKKFKNGKVKLQVEKCDRLSDGTVDENVYHDDMCCDDLYIHQINGYQYVVDFNTSTVYELGSYLLQNPLKWILDILEEEGRMYLYPLTKRESLSLLEDLENGY